MKSRNRIQRVLIIVLFAISLYLLIQTIDYKQKYDRLIQKNSKIEAKIEQLNESLRSSLDDTMWLEKELYLGKNQPFNTSKDELEQYQQQLLKYQRYIPDKEPTKKNIISRGYFPENNHFAFDFAGSKFDTIFAAGSGVVESTTNNDKIYGTALLIDHLNSFKTFYGHNAVNLVKAGELVEKGQPIATIGTSGQTTAPHVHFEIRYKGTNIDPGKLLKKY